MISHAVRGRFEQLQNRELEFCAPGGRLAEAGQEHLGVEVVLVVDETLAERPPQQGQRPVGVRWIARLDGAEAVAHSHLDGQDRRAQPAVDELQEVTEESAGRAWRRVFVDVHPVDRLTARVARPLRADDRHADARFTQARHSSHTRRSSGTGRFWTIIKTRRRRALTTRSPPRGTADRQPSFRLTTEADCIRGRHYAPAGTRNRCNTSAGTILNASLRASVFPQHRKLKSHGNTRAQLLVILKARSLRTLIGGPKDICPALLLIGALFTG